MFQILEHVQAIFTKKKDSIQKRNSIVVWIIHYILEDPFEHYVNFSNSIVGDLS